MAESSQKRCREEEETQQGEAETKRQCSFHHILSILESDEEDPTQDLSSLITTLQQELFTHRPQSEPTLNNQTQTDPTNSFSSPPPSPTGLFKEDNEEEVIRQLLEALDDDLGETQRENEVGIGGEVSTCGGMWELDDEAANYYTLVQSKLFL
ncbi:hypothetical protein MRB53_000050 [Persea americana]|uniref:Uncharacterized protein n=1 Tax=Persea americana TaxID=3435 RepID=A0ACC2MQ69_PERAE|nr:hypothetical protein MRB53_000050 [Persea americana]